EREAERSVSAGAQHVAFEDRILDLQRATCALASVGGRALYVRNIHVLFFSVGLSGLRGGRGCLRASLRRRQRGQSDQPCEKKCEASHGPPLLALCQIPLEFRHC